MGSELGAVVDAIRANDRFLLVTHENPDGDALGSILATKLALDTFGKDYRNRWKAETACRKGYTTADCKNGPKTQATTSTGAAQQQPTTGATGTTTQP